MRGDGNPVLPHPLQVTHVRPKGHRLVLAGHPERNEGRMSRATYEIRVVGEVPPELLEDFEGVALVAESMDTTLRAQLTDSAALNGLLIALRHAGLVLLDVRREIAMDGADASNTDRPAR
jgi:hypothetical protein